MREPRRWIRDWPQCNRLHSLSSKIFIRFYVELVTYFAGLIELCQGLRNDFKVFGCMVIGWQAVLL